MHFKTSCAAIIMLLSQSFLSATCASLPFSVGAYLGDPDNSNSANEGTFEAAYTSFLQDLGTGPSLLLAYVDYTQPVSLWVGNSDWEATSHAQSPDASGRVPVIGLPMASIASGSPSPDAQYQAFASGQYDNVIEGIVAAWAQQGFTQLVIRPGWEMNITGNTFVGADSQSQTDWVLAFRHIYNVLHASAASNNVSVQVVWNPSVTNYDTVGTQNLYPGDAYVDIIGADAYAGMYPFSDGGSTPTYHDWATGQEDTSLAVFMADPINRWHYWEWPAATEWSLDSSQGHNLSLSALILFARQHGKPFAIPEAGAGNCNGGNDVCDDPTYPFWLAARLNRAASNGLTISFVNIWDSNGGGNYEFSFAADGKPLEAAAWALAFGTQ